MAQACACDLGLHEAFLELSAEARAAAKESEKGAAAKGSAAAKESAGVSRVQFNRLLRELNRSGVCACSRTVLIHTT